MSGLPTAVQADMNVATWNIYGGRSAPDKRYDALFNILQPLKPHVIALQEVDEPFLHRAVQQPALGNHKAVSTPDCLQGGLAFLVNLPVMHRYCLDLPGPLGRKALFVEVKKKGQNWLFVTLHLESFLEDGPWRQKQLAKIKPLFQRYPAPHKVLLGDFNFGDAEHKTAAVLASFQLLDIWRLRHPGQPGFSWDRTRNYMADRNSFDQEPSRRLDRILLKSSTMQPKHITLLGTQSIGAAALPWQTLFPSDHFGLFAQFAE
ncbi:endonuclease/exonuclease/phosphatase family protein [Magnetococcus sp. PR-3]|uniref:endonuclease/exonuclease/phosphatase family protein n=1 Tax=Magnetococcus sp. PR-3 TaxID=3120355 RepID=UPI002FCE14C7